MISVTNPRNCTRTFGAFRCKVLLETVFTVFTVLFLNKSYIEQFTAALLIAAHKMFRTPRFVQCQHKWATVKSRQVG